jgi:branched-chain amino acid transport system substrate-binding protein
MKTRRISIRVLMLVALTLLALAVACGWKGPITIGFVAGLSGRVADLGVPGRNGVMLAVEQCNAGGGIKRRPVHLIVQDDQQNPESAKKAAAELIEAKVEAIIGPMTSSMAVAVVPLANAASTIMVSPTVTTPELAGVDDYFVRVIGITSEYAALSARYQAERLGKRTAVAIYDVNNKAYTENWFNDFQKAYASFGGRILRATTYQSGEETPFLNMVADLLALKPEMVLIIANSVDAALICQQVRKIDPEIAIAMSEWASTERFIELAGTASENVYVAQFLDRNDTSQRFLSFHKAYMERFGQEPGFAGVAGYDAAQVVLDAIALRRPGQSLKNAIIETGRFQCLQQQITINRFGDAERKTFSSVIRNGRYITLE